MADLAANSTGDAVRQTVLYPNHLLLTPKSRMAPFAGYWMPLWYSGIAHEHAAVRTRAGLFDVSHMGVLEFSGPDAEAFLNAIATNNVTLLSPLQAQYAYILDANGHILDDIIIYKRQANRFMVVVNAANEPKIKAYITDLLRDTALLKRSYQLDFADLRAQPNGRGRVNIALQGPQSRNILLALADPGSDHAPLTELKGFRLLHTTLAGMDVIVSGTGYTGSKTGVELFVSPENAPRLWDCILETGKPFGVEPCGLGARDSLRIEAGLPLYGHELAGEHDISPYECGYGWAVKLDKPFFVGKDAMLRRADRYDMEIVRLELPGQKGIRPARANDGVLDDGGRCVGWITSNAGIGQSQVALAYVARGAVTAGQNVGVYYLSRSAAQTQQGRKERVSINESLSADLTGNVVTRYAKF